MTDMDKDIRAMAQIARLFAAVLIIAILAVVAYGAYTWREHNLARQHAQCVQTGGPFGDTSNC